ncbi:MAG: SDR family oxidoreductase [Phormidesmis sp.]
MVKAAIVGCGYVGSAIARQWQVQGLAVLATTTRPERISELSVIAHQAKVLQGNDTNQMQAVLADRQLVLLCVGSKRGASYADTYLGTAQTLAQVLPNTAVQQVIYTSTSSVYGHQQGAWVTEDMPPQPATENGQVIAATERSLLETATPQRRVCILRLGGIYGPGRTLEKIYSRAAGTTRPGKGDQATNWVHLSDIVGAIDWARQQQLAGIYNVVQDEIPTVRELIGRVCDRYRLAPVQWDETQPSNRSYNVRISNAKLKSTGYSFVHPTFDL